MPLDTSSSPTAKTFTRHVAPFAPLALALLMNAVPSSSPVNGSLSDEEIPDKVTAMRCEENIADFEECHNNYPTGCSKAAGYDAYLNYLKNETPSPAAGGITFLDQQAFDAFNASTPPGLGQENNHADFKDQLARLGEGSQRGLIGYLYYFQATGAESSNCELTGPDKEGGNVDFHIGIGFDSVLAGQAKENPKLEPSLKKKLQQNSVIVEMTPYYRAHFQDGIWTLANLKPALGHKVKVVGQLLVDSEHNRPSDNCALDGTSSQKNHCWRYSVWELHPVTEFEYCSSDSCTEDSADWVPLGIQSAGSHGTDKSAHTNEAAPEGGKSSENPSRTSSHRSKPASK